MFGAVGKLMTSHSRIWLTISRVALFRISKMDIETNYESDFLEPYTCTGHFQNDFYELCRRQNMVVIPPVVLRAKRPVSPIAAPAQEEKASKGPSKGKDDKKAAPVPEPEPEPELDEHGGSLHFYAFSSYV